MRAKIIPIHMIATHLVSLTTSDNKNHIHIKKTSNSSHIKKLGFAEKNKNSKNYSYNS